jgi:hypothetical protein
MARGDFEAIKRAMAQRKAGVFAAMHEATKENTDELWKASRANMNRDIYGNPPDKTKAGEKRKLAKGRRGGKGFKWTQSGNLLRSEKRKVIGVEGFIHNQAKAKGGETGYAHARHNLALSRGDSRVIPPPPKRKRKSSRIAPWRADAIEELGEKRLATYRKHLLNALNRP